MSIRTRTLAIIGMTLLVLTAVLYAFSQLILLEGYLSLEKENIERNIQRALNAVQQKIAFYHNTSVDYAHWDDTYSYMQGQYESYIEENILTSVFSNYDLEFIIFVNPAGEIVFSQGYTLESQEMIPVSDDLIEYVTENPSLALPRDEQENILLNGLSGIVLLAERSIILAATPILQSDETGEPMGALIWGRTLDKALMNELSEQTQLSLAIRPIEADDPTALSGQPVFIDLIGDQDSIGTTPLYDIDGVPSLMLQSEGQRSVYQQGQHSITYFVVSLVLMSLISAGGIAVMLDRTVLSRIAALNGQVSRIRQNSDVASRVAVSGDDEVSSLATNINGMLESLQAQEKIKLARDNALEAARLKAEILANVSHDARTPLSVIILRSEMLLKGMYGALSEKQKDVFQQILLSSDQLMGFINNLLEGAQLDAGQLRLHYGTFEPARLVEHTRTALEPLAQRKNLRFETVIAGDVPEALCGDEKRLERILTNLVSNAIKFTTTGGVTLRVSRPDADHWSVEVRDTGIGIAPDNQQRIFDAFWQVDGSKTRAASSGVGLGLSIVHQLTELMGGTIAVDSHVGSGSAFTITLPINPPVKTTSHE